MKTFARASGSDRRPVGCLATIVFLGIAAVPPPAAVAADPNDYGTHVAECAQVTGFDGVHNPGVHEGFSGWNPDHAC